MHWSYALWISKRYIAKLQSGIAKKQLFFYIKHKNLQVFSWEKSTNTSTVYIGLNFLKLVDLVGKKPREKIWARLDTFEVICYRMSNWTKKDEYLQKIQSGVRILDKNTEWQNSEYQMQVVTKTTNKLASTLISGRCQLKQVKRSFAKLQNKFFQIPEESVHDYPAIPDPIAESIAKFSEHGKNFIPQMKQSFQAVSNEIFYFYQPLKSSFCRKFLENTLFLYLYEAFSSPQKPIPNIGTLGPEELYHWHK